MSETLAERAAARSLRTRYPIIFRAPIPAAGAEFTITVPGGVVWIPVNIRATLVTGGAVANRLPQFLFDDGTTVFYSIGPSAVQAASSTDNYNLAVGVGNNFQATADFVMPVPRFQLGAGFRIRSVTALLQGADQWSPLTLYVEEIQTTSLTRAEAEALLDDPPAWASYLG